MSQIQYVLLGALLMFACVAGADMIHPAHALGGGPYQLMKHSNPTAAAGVFRLDTTSGGVAYCYVTPGSDVVCTREVR